MLDPSLARTTRRLIIVAATTATLHSEIACGLVTEPPCRYPLSWTGLWRVDRYLEEIEGDAAGAETAWAVSGGTGSFVLGHREQYSVRFLLDNEASIADWGFEICSRCSLAEAAVTVNPPDELRYQRPGRGATSTSVRVEARVDTRTLSKFGTIERWRALTSGSDKALLMEVSRSYQPVNDQGNIQGRESIRTYSVLPGKGKSRQEDELRLETPTSTSRSSLTLCPLERPLIDPVRRTTWDAG